MKIKIKSIKISQPSNNWIKTSMAAWVGQTIPGALKSKNWFIDLFADAVPPEVGITALRKIDPEIALNLPRIYHATNSDVKEIDGRQYLITDIEEAKKTKPSFVTMIDIATGDVVRKNREEVMPKLKEISAPKLESIKNKLNVEIKKYNDRISAIEDATSNLSLLPLQLSRVVKPIEDRIDVLNEIVNHTQAKLEVPKPEAMTEWEEGTGRELLTGDLDEVTFVDTILHHYKYRYDELVNGLKAPQGDPSRIEIPQNVNNPDLLRQKLISMGELAFQSYVDSIKNKNKKGPVVPFDIGSVEFGPLQEFGVEDIPESYKSTGYRSYDAYETSLKQTIRGSEANKNLLIKMKDALNELGQKLGSLKEGQRSSKYLRSTPEGQEIVKDLTDFVNEKLGPFVTQYKNEIIDSKTMKVDSKKLGRKGGIGNALLVVDFARLYTVISKILDNVSIEGQIPSERQEVERVVEETEPTDKSLVKSKFSNNYIKKMSELLWIPFANRMKLK